MDKKKIIGSCMTLIGLAYMAAFFAYNDAFAKVNDTVCLILTLISVESIVWGIILLLHQSQKELKEEETRKKEENSKLSKYYKSKPHCTHILIGINVSVFVLIHMMQGGDVFPYAISKNDFAFYRIFTSMFTHAGGFHLLLNMGALNLCGSKLEALIGNIKYLSVYMISGICSSILTALFSNTPCVGASGAIFGLFGCYLLLAYRNRNIMKYTYKHDLLPTVIFNLVVTFLIPNISIPAHLGGLAAGMLSYFILCRKIILK